MPDTRPLEPFGVELLFDLSDEGNIALLRSSFEEHGLVVARDQNLTHEQQRAIMSAIGNVLDHLSTVNVVSNVRPDGYLGDSEVNYHSDASYTPEPMQAIGLHALRIERPGESSTKIANGVRALELLPGDLRVQLDNLEVLHLAAVGEGTLGGRQRLADYPIDGPRAVHPLVMRDSVTRRLALYAPYTNADQILGLDPGESEALLQRLQRIMFAKENVYEHFWREGDLMIWSNVGCLHARGAMPGGERTLRRICTTDASLEVYEESTRLIQQVRRTVLK